MVNKKKQFFKNVCKIIDFLQLISFYVKKQQYQCFHDNTICYISYIGNLNRFNLKTLVLNFSHW